MNLNNLEFRHKALLPCPCKVKRWLTYLQKGWVTVQLRLFILIPKNVVERWLEFWADWHLADSHNTYQYIILTITHLKLCNDEQNLSNQEYRCKALPPPLQGKKTTHILAERCWVTVQLRFFVIISKNVMESWLAFWGVWHLAFDWLALSWGIWQTIITPVNILF